MVHEATDIVARCQPESPLRATRQCARTPGPGRDALEVSMKTWHCNPLRASARALAVGLGVWRAVASAALLAGPGGAATVGAILTPPPPDWYTCRGTGSG